MHRECCENAVPALSSGKTLNVLDRSGVQVMHVHGGAVHEHFGPDRSGLVAEVEEFWDGQADPMASSDVAEFRDDAHRLMVEIVEGC